MSAEKVEKSRNTVVCSMSCGSGGSKSRLAKAGQSAAARCCCQSAVALGAGAAAE